MEIVISQRTTACCEIVISQRWCCCGNPFVRWSNVCIEYGTRGVTSCSLLEGMEVLCTSEARMDVIGLMCFDEEKIHVVFF